MAISTFEKNLLKYQTLLKFVGNVLDNFFSASPIHLTTAFHQNTNRIDPEKDDIFQSAFLLETRLTISMWNLILCHDPVRPIFKIPGLQHI